MPPHAWGATPPPWRPDALDMSRYSDLFSHRPLSPRSHALLLGGTKEVRELLSQVNVPYDLIDYSEHMVALSTPTAQDSMNATILGDWRTSLPTEKSYGVILGDLSLNLLNTDETRGLLGRLWNLLTPGGILSFRIRLKTREPQSACISLFTKQLETFPDLSPYILLATAQTLHALNPTIVPTLIETRLSSLKDSQTREDLKAWRDTFLGSGLAYTLHEEQALRDSVPHTTFLHARSYAEYLDTFVFMHSIKVSTQESLP